MAIQTAMQASGYTTQEVTELTAFAKSQGWTQPVEADAEHSAYQEFKAGYYAEKYGDPV